MRTQRHIRNLILASSILALSVGLAACGITTAASGGVTPIGTNAGGTVPASSGTSGNCGRAASPAASPVSTQVITPVVTGSIQPKPVQPHGTGTPIVGGGAEPAENPSATALTPVANATVTPGQITLTPNKTTYASCDSIQVVVANGLSSAIFVADHQTSCTIMTLQHLVNGAWQDVGRCQLETPTRLIEISGGQAIAQTLSPGAGSMRGAGGWAAGTYRAALRYLTGSDNNGDAAPHQQQPIYSATFTIG